MRVGTANVAGRAGALKAAGRAGATNVRGRAGTTNVALMRAAWDTRPNACARAPMADPSARATARNPTPPAVMVWMDAEPRAADTARTTVAIEARASDAVRLNDTRDVVVAALAVVVAMKRVADRPRVAALPVAVDVRAARRRCVADDKAASGATDATAPRVRVCRGVAADADTGDDAADCRPATTPRTAPIIAGMPDTAARASIPAPRATVVRGDVDADVARARVIARPATVVDVADEDADRATMTARMAIERGATAMDATRDSDPAVC